jgi:hypothetical protein
MEPHRKLSISKRVKIRWFQNEHAKYTDLVGPPFLLLTFGTDRLLGDHIPRAPMELFSRTIRKIKVLGYRGCHVG